MVFLDCFSSLGLVQLVDEAKLVTTGNILYLVLTLESYII
jgi:hypothetical protein